MAENGCQIFVIVAQLLLAICHLKKVVEEEEVVEKNVVTSHKCKTAVHNLGRHDPGLD